MKILDYRVKLNEDFQGNIGGHFMLSRYKKNNMWVYEIPNLKVREGDRLYYWLRISLGREAFDVVVKGVFDITSELVIVIKTLRCKLLEFVVYWLK